MRPSHHKLTVGQDARSGKRQSTAGRVIRRCAVQYRGLPLLCSALQESRTLVWFTAAARG